MSSILKKSIITLSVLALSLFAVQAFAQDEWEKTASEINDDQDKALRDVAALQEYIEMDEAALQKELAKLKEQENKEERLLNRLEKEFINLRKEEDQHKKDLADEEEEIESIKGTVRATGNDAVSFARDNPITAEHTERIDMLDKIVSAKRLPGLDDLKNLVEFYFEEMEESGKIFKRTGEFIGPDGKTTTGEIIRIGRFTTYFRLPNGTVGFLKPEASGKRLVAFTGEPPGWMLDQISDYFKGESDVAPVDLSNGGFFVQLTKTITPTEKLEQGGVIMYVILGVGIFAVLLGLERIIVLGTKSKASEKVMNEIKNMANRGDWKEAQEYCSSKSRIPTCQMLDSAMDHVGASQEVLENALTEGILRQVPRLERFIPTLALFAVVSPLLGLLGTVSGMIKTFEIITEVGTGDPGMLAGGISEALLTTQFGLVVAIPIMLVHHFLKSQVDKIVNDMEEKGTAFIITLSKESGKTEEA